MFGNNNVRTPLLPKNASDHESESAESGLINKGYIFLYFGGLSWSPLWYFTLNGSMNMMIYLWVIKDFCWSQDNYYGGMTVGTIALVWSLYSIFLAFQIRNYHEVWQGIGQFLWLFGNYWWMTGELYCSKFKTDDYSFYNRTNKECGYVMIAAFIWLLIFYLIIVPFKIIIVTRDSEEVYNAVIPLKSPYPSLFTSWRDYENIHMILWLGKDLAWNYMNVIMWYFFLIPTIVVAADYVRYSLTKKNLFIESTHYLAVLIWVCANATWAVCDFYHANDDFPRTKAIYIFDTSSAAVENYRWWASWIFLMALVPIIVMYALWLPISLNKT